ncbi:ZapG family protein [Salinicola acroporae]|uniref:DUF1043 domain-containing protein n=1 Tax=Salinicola acroporae TaxID=1541440 RepID=A0ABT6I1Z8_9GAMM|nr:DUF1043 family protein [Salinicola acroporae]MDH4571454.1 DUF1043 domain-containing protein [Salinicola acroporae]
MESIGVGPWIAIVVAVGAVGVLVGYWLGTKMGGHNTEPMRELNREHTAYKEDVREHFEQVSATMTRMVEDYREMYHHVAKGAEKLADMHHETVIEPPPKPEAITQDRPAGDEASDTPTADEAGKEKVSPASSAPRETPSATAPTASGAAAKSSASSSATGAGAPSASTRPQDAAIRAAAEDAATSQKR